MKEVRYLSFLSFEICHFAVGLDITRLGEQRLQGFESETRREINGWPTSRASKALGSRRNLAIEIFLGLSLYCFTFSKSGIKLWNIL